MPDKHAKYKKTALSIKNTFSEHGKIIIKKPENSGK